MTDHPYYPDPRDSAALQPSDNGRAAALHEAVAAIYFADRSNYLTALWEVVRLLDPDTATLLEEHPETAWNQTGDAINITTTESEA